MAHDIDARCLCVADHRPSVLEYERHHIYPLGMGGLDTPENVVWVCPTAHANTHEMLRLMLAAGRSIGDAELSRLEPRPINRYSADLARAGYAALIDHQQGDRA